MKNKLLFVPLLILYGFAFVNAFSGNGDGSSGVPYEITNCTQLQEMEDNFSASYILVNEINCSDTINWNDSSGFSPIGSGVGDEDYFFGTFNGQGYKIINLYINRNIETYIGLFGYIINATISNINLENVNILGNAEVGGLVGYNNGGTILNSSVSGNVTEIVDYQKAGCLVGENTLGTIDKSFSNCSLIGHGWGTGGLLGANNNGLINNSYSIGDITGTTWVGGLLGYNTGTIVNSYSTGNVNGGGLLGYPDSGGLLGYADTGSLVENSFWDIETSGKDISAGGIGKTTSEMKNIRTYTQTNFSSGLLYAWDFVGNPLDDINDEDIWNLDSNRTINNGYPFFSTLQSIPQYNISEFPADTTPPIMEIISPTENGIYNLSTWTGVTLNYDDSVTCEYSSDNLTWYSFTSCDNTSNYVPTNGIDQTLYVRGIDEAENIGYVSPVTFTYDNCAVCNEICSPCGGGCTATDMTSMFAGVTDWSSIGDITQWNTSCITDMSGMFYNSNFNQDISSWDVSNVQVMAWMFYGDTAFDQNIGNWDISNVREMDDMFTGMNLSTTNYDALLNGWSVQSLQSYVIFGAGSSKYSSFGIMGRNILTDTYKWIIYDDGANDTTPPVMEVTFPTENEIYNAISWTGVTLNYDDSVTCEYSSDNLTWYSFTSCDNTSNYVPTNGINQILYVRGKDSANNIGYATPVTFTYDIIPPVTEITFPIRNGTYNAISWTGVTLNYDDSVTCEYYTSDNLTWYSFTSCDNTSNYVPTNGINQILYVRGKDSANNIGYVIAVTFTYDATAPVFTIIPPDSSIFYGNESLLVQFEGNDETAFDSYSINDTRFVINQTGFLSNVTPMNVGNYEINVTINDTSNNTAWTIYKVQVNKSNYGCNVLFNSTSPLFYPNVFLVYSDCDSEATLYKNETVIDNNSVQNSGSGYFNYTVQRADTENYTNTGDTEFFIIDKSVDSCLIYFNTTSSINYSDNFVTYTNCTSAYTLYKDGTSISNASIINSGVGYYNLTVQRADTENYTNIFDTEFFTVNRNQEEFNVLFNVTSPLTYSDIFLVYANSTSAFILHKNGTVIANNSVQNSEAGYFNFSAQRMDISNYSFNYYETSFIVNKNVENCQVLFNVTSPLSFPNTFLVWANCTTPFALMRNGTVISNNTEQALIISAYNFSVLREDNFNYTLYYNEIQMRIVDATAPVFTIIPPDSSIFYGNESLLVQFEGNDETAFDSYSINDTNNFSINSSGFLFNKTFLAVGDYEINVTINDTFNNINWTIFNIKVKEIPVINSTPVTPRTSGGGGGGGGKKVIIVANQTNQSNQAVQTNQETQPSGANESQQGTPSKLFDIKLELDSTILNSSNKLSSVITFTSFGSVPTAVDLTYSVLNSSGEEVYREKGNVTVTTEQIVRKNFKNLSLPSGKYTLVLTTVYNDNVKDEFRQDFSVENRSSGVGIYLLIGIISILLIGTLIVIYSRHRIKLRYKN